MDPQTMTETLNTQLGYTSNLFLATLTGLTNDDALMQPGQDGNCLNWVTGHIVQARGSALALLGQKLPFSANKYDRYLRGSAPITDAREAVTLSAMLTDFAATEERLKAGLASLTAKRLAEKAPFSPSNNKKETVGSLLAGMVFHEGYHIGQLGLLRRLVGEEAVVK